MLWMGRDAVLSGTNGHKWIGNWEFPFIQKGGTRGQFCVKRWLLGAEGTLLVHFCVVIYQVDLKGLGVNLSCHPVILPEELVLVLILNQAGLGLAFHCILLIVVHLRLGFKLIIM